MPDLTFLDLFQKWPQGDPIQGGTLVLGIKIVWISRLAKILQMISGLVIIIQIIGNERIQHLGQKLEHRHNLRRILKKKPKIIRREKIVKRLKDRLIGIPPKHLAVKVKKSIWHDPEWDFHRSDSEVEEEPEPNPDYNEAEANTADEFNKRIKQRISNHSSALWWHIKLPAILISSALTAAAATAILNPKYIENAAVIFEMKIAFLLTLFITCMVANTIIIPILLNITITLLVGALRIFFLKPVGLALSNPSFEKLALTLSLIFFLLGSSIDILLS